MGISLYALLNLLDRIGGGGGGVSLFGIALKSVQIENRTGDGLLFSDPKPGWQVACHLTSHVAPRMAEREAFYFSGQLILFKCLRLS